MPTNSPLSRCRKPVSIGHTSTSSPRARFVGSCSSDLAAASAKLALRTRCAASSPVSVVGFGAAALAALTAPSNLLIHAKTLGYCFSETRFFGSASFRPLSQSNVQIAGGRPVSVLSVVDVSMPHLQYQPVTVLRFSIPILGHLQAVCVPETRKLLGCGQLLLASFPLFAACPSSFH